MDASGKVSCQKCRMVFRSSGLLEKHKDSFCIGHSTGDLVLLRRRQTGRRKLYPNPDLITLREQRLLHFGSMQGRITDPEQRAGIESDQTGSVLESLTSRNLTDKFHKLRMPIEGATPDLPTWLTEKQDLDQVLEKQSDHRGRLRELVKEHHSQLAEIQARNQLLEEQRDAITRKLGVMAEQGTTPARLESLQLEPRERVNREALHQLVDHVTNLQPPAIRSDTPKSEARNGQHLCFDLMCSEDEPVSTQIRALMLAYMQSGGSDLAVQTQMHDLLTEALSLEQQTEPVAGSKGSRKRIKPPQWAVNSEILRLEQENRRLDEEIFRIQIASGKPYRGDTVGSELRQIPREHMHPLASVQSEIKSLHVEIERAREGPRGRRLPPLLPRPSAQIQPGPHSSLRGRHVLDPLDSLARAPYYPAAGLVVFYDLVLGVDAMSKVLRLVAGLYSEGQEVRLRSPLPPTQCQSGGTLSSGKYAPLAVKQLMPRLQPSPSLSLVLELQTAEYGQSVQSFLPLGWARLELFDQQNQVQSGFWRVPVRALPIRPALSPGQLNSVQQVGDMEVCLRVFSAQDDDRQCLFRIDPNNTSMYKFLSMVSNLPASC